MKVLHLCFIVCIACAYTAQAYLIYNGKYIFLSPKSNPKDNKHDIDLQIENPNNVQKGTHMRLVKRKVSHGHPSDTYEYQGKLNAVYKPLVRIHKTIKPKLDDTVAPKLAGKKPKTVKKSRIKTEYLARKVLHKIFKVLQKPQRGDTSDIVLGEIRKLVEKYNKLHPFKLLLRSIDDDDGDLTDEVEELTTPCPILQHQLSSHKYPYHVNLWNYWLYHKAIHEDDCPLNQVRNAKVCIRLPEH